MDNQERSFQPLFRRQHIAYLHWIWTVSLSNDWQLMSVHRPFFSVKSPEIFFLTTRSFLFQDPRLSQADLQPLQKVNVLRSILRLPTIYLPEDCLKRKKSCWEVFLACRSDSSCIHSPWPSLLFRNIQNFSQNTVSSESKQAKKGKSQCRRCSRAALNEFPKIVNPGIKALMATSLQDLQRDQRVMTKWLWTQGARS